MRPTVQTQPLPAAGPPLPPAATDAVARPDTKPDSRGQARRTVLGVVVFLLTVAGGAWLLRSLDLASFERVLGGMAPLPLVAAVLVNLVVNYGARAQRWGALYHGLPGAPRLGFLERYSLSVAGQATNSIFPMRAGDAWRALEVTRRTGLPLRDLVTVQLAEKAVEVVALGLLSLPVVLDARFVARPLGLTIAGLVLSALAVAVVFYRSGAVGPVAEAEPPRAADAPGGRGVERVAVSLAAKIERAVAALLAQLATMLAALRRLAGSSALWRSFLWAFTSDVSDVAMIWLVAQGAAFPLSFSGCVAVWAGVNLAIALPAAPAQLGVLEAGAVLVLRLLGAGDAQALAIALVYHAAHLIPTLLAGLVALGVRTLRGPTQARRRALAEADA